MIAEDMRVILSRVDMAAGELAACCQIRANLIEVIDEGHIPNVAIDRLLKCCNDVREQAYDEYTKASTDLAACMFPSGPVTA